MVVIKCNPEKYRQKLVDEFMLTNPSAPIDVIQRHVDAHIFRNIPDDWKDLLKNKKLKFQIPSSYISIIDDYCPFESYFEVLCASNTKAFKKKREKVILKHGKEHPYVSELFEHVDKQSASSSRVRKAKATYNKAQFTQWTTECTLIAYRTQAYGDIGCPLAAWKIRAKLLLPLGSNFKSKYEQVPIVRVEVLETTHYGETEAALYEAIHWFIENYADEITWLLTTEEAGYSDGENYSAQIKIEVFFESNDYKNRDAFAVWFNQRMVSIEGQNRFGDRSNIEPVNCSIFTGGAPIEDIPKIKNVRKEATQYGEGELFILCEFQLNNICVFSDAKLYSKNKVDVRESYLDEWGISPEEMLNQLHFDRSMFYADVESGISWHESIEDIVEGDGDRFCAIRDALIALDVPLEKYKHPWVLLLIDPISRRHRIELGRKRRSVSDFLANNLTLVNSNGTLPKAVKAPANMLKGNPQVKSEINKLGIDVVRPLSGVDAGARLSGLWRDVAESLTKDEFIPDHPTPYKWKWSEFVFDIKVVSEYFNGGSEKALERIGPRYLFFPESLKSIPKKR